MVKIGKKFNWSLWSFKYCHELFFTIFPIFSQLCLSLMTYFILSLNDMHIAIDEWLFTPPSALLWGLLKKSFFLQFYQVCLRDASYSWLYNLLQRWDLKYALLHNIARWKELLHARMNYCVLGWTSASALVRGWTSAR